MQIRKRGRENTVLGRRPVLKAGRQARRSGGKPKSRGANAAGEPLKKLGEGNEGFYPAMKEPTAKGALTMLPAPGEGAIYIRTKSKKGLKAGMKRRNILQTAAFLGRGGVKWIRHCQGGVGGANQVSPSQNQRRLGKTFWE